MRVCYTHNRCVNVHGKELWWENFVNGVKCRFESEIFSTFVEFTGDCSEFCVR